MRKFVQNALTFKTVLFKNDIFWSQIIPTLGPIISRTKYDRDKMICSAEYKNVWICQKGGTNKVKVPYNR